jgi:hypothetical protein
MAPIDRTTTLCLACSSSLPPSSHDAAGLFTTPCCHRPICPSCVASNPRLTRYDPCLACLGGVGVVARRSGSGGASVRDSRSTGARDSGTAARTTKAPNVDGSVRDEDAFVVGDDDDDDSDESETTVDHSADGPPPSTSLTPAPLEDPEPASQPTHPAEDPESASEATIPAPPIKYYLKKGDTLNGIALRFNLDVPPSLTPMTFRYPLTTPAF